MARKLHILYCDDQQRFLDAFAQRHADEFEVETLSDVSGVVRRLRESKRLPDLLLLDLYHPLDVADFESGRVAAEAKLQELRSKIAEVKPSVDRVWAPVATHVLDEIRTEFPSHKLPILIYTQRGLLLLDDGDLRAIETSDADWLLKDANRISAVTESIRIKKFVRLMRRQRQLDRDIVLGAIFTFAGALLGVAASLVVG